MIHNIYLCDCCGERCKQLTEWISMETEYRKSTDVGRKFDLCPTCVDAERSRVDQILQKRAEIKKRMQDFV